MDQDQSAPDPHAESEAVLELRKELEEKARSLRDSGLADYLVRDRLRKLCQEQQGRCEQQQALISNVGFLSLIALFAGFFGAMLSEYPISLVGVISIILACSALAFIGGKSIVIGDKLEEIDRFSQSEGLMENERDIF